MTDNQAKYVYKTTIKEAYGLTDSWIKRLGEPDKVAPNPHYRSKKSYLYLRRRVEAFIGAHQDEYDELLKKRAARSAKMQAIADRRVEALLSWAEKSPVQVGELPRQLAKLKRRLTDDFQNFRAYQHGDFLGEFTMSPNAIVAHVRHTSTNYEDLLLQIEGKPGCHVAYLIIREHCDAAIEKRLDDKYGDCWRK